MKAPENIDSYIATFPGDVQQRLNEIRKAIQQAAPDAVETIKYAMPTYVQQGNLVHFAGYKNHIGFYPAPNAIVEFSNELSGYKTSKGAIQFPLTHPMPLDLIRRITEYRIRQNSEKARAKKK